MFKLSLSTGTLYHLPLRCAFALAREAGFGGVELVCGAEVFLRGAAPVRALTKEFALPVLSVHPPIIPYPRYHRIDRMGPYMVRLAEQLNADLVVLHTPKTTSETSPAWARFMAFVARHDSGRGVRLSLENGGVYRPADNNHLLHDLRRLSAFAENHGLCITLDTAHAGATPYTLFEAHQLCRGRLANVHFSDLASSRFIPALAPFHTLFVHHQLPGDGTLPLVEFTRTLLQTHYTGYLTIEVSPTALKVWSANRIRERLERSVSFVREVEESMQRECPAEK